MSTTSKASQRIASLLDDNSFAQIGALVTARATDFNLDPKMTPSDGCITGYGTIGDKLVYVYAQDASVLGGTIGEMHARKIVNLYNLALKMGAPVIGLLDCAGMRLQEATDALYAFGRIYAKQSAASGVIPQITAILGNCGGGLAPFPTMTDFTFMAKEGAQLFVNAPNAIAGNRVEKCDTASAAFQSAETGIVDVVADETEIFAQIRKLVSFLPANNEDVVLEDCTDDLNRAVEGIAGCKGDTAIALSLIADDSDFFEVKADYAKEMVTGFLRLNGSTVGAVANRCQVFDAEGKEAAKFDAVLTADGCEKAADFIRFCDAFEIPVLSLTNVKGFDATIDSEKRVARAAAKLVDAFAGATVPKVNVVVGDALGNAANVMNAKAIGADLTISWEGARIGTMEGKLAAQVLAADKSADEQKAVAKEYDEELQSAQSAARRGYVDQIIDPADTRKYVIAAFEMLYSKRDTRPEKKHTAV
ncbi:MAG: carboxyl transferase [Lachnospiraceae bacterium]|nr:carboxyl transferase [Lachnospiraceae bacterium]